jgi:hypothetical protein
MTKRRVTATAGLVIACRALAVAAQSPEPAPSFTSLATYAISFPLGDTRRFVATPSWAGAGWEGLWALSANLSAGFAVGMHDFYDHSFSTENFLSGSATGDQLRDLVLTTLMATVRWCPVGQRAVRPFVGVGSGGLYAQQYYQLQPSSPFSRAALHFVVAPEAGAEIHVIDGVDADAGLRYTTPRTGGSYLGGGARSFRYVTLSVGIAERW